MASCAKSAVVFALALGLTTCAHAVPVGFVLDFVARPTSPAMPELVWDGMELYDGSGALGSGFDVLGPGDGELPAGQQSPGGLQLQVPFELLGVPGSEVGSDHRTTTFYDVTLDIIPTQLGASRGLMAADSAQEFAGVYLLQALGAGEFHIWSTDGDDGSDESQQLLLAGTIHSAVISGIRGASAGAVLSARVTYTDGLIYDACRDGDGPVTGEFSWSLLDISPVLETQGPTLRPFETNATGQFIIVAEEGVIPEPVMVSLLGAGGVAALLRPRRRRPVRGGSPR